MEQILRKRVTFSTAQELRNGLNALDPAFLEAAALVEYDYMEQLTLSGDDHSIHWLTFEAVVSPAT